MPSFHRSSIDMLHNFPAEIFGIQNTSVMITTCNGREKRNSIQTSQSQPEIDYSIVNWDHASRQKQSNGANLISFVLH